MGRHNGKSRASGLPVGQALVKRKPGKTREKTAHGNDMPSERHTTDLAPSKQSIVAMTDLDELMSMAVLADRDFAAERHEPVVINMGNDAAATEQLDGPAKRELEEKHRHRLTVPRRPAWTADMTSQELDMQEKAHFLEWRRNIAVAEEETGLSVTPFEKNLEVWRQLWRVLERSQVVAQVVDARNPLFYYCEDLVQYGLDMQPPKQTVLILNKADLLPLEYRKAWAAYFSDRDIKFCFFSAKLEDPTELKKKQGVLKSTSVADAADTEDSASNSDSDGDAVDGHSADGDSDAADEDDDVRVCNRNELIERLKGFALYSIKKAGGDCADGNDNSGFGEGHGHGHAPFSRFSVGLVGYPNVGKSSTINALKGEKKTVVSSTPGKTKHFQTLHVSEDLCVCDCPGLVYPRFAESKSHMVTSGVLPINHLTNNVRGPLDIIASHFSIRYLNRFYHLTLPLHGESTGLEGEGKAKELLRCSGKQLAKAHAVQRGHMLMGGRADEMRAGRKILKDYVDGKLCYCHAPPGLTIEQPGTSNVPDCDEGSGEEKLVLDYAGSDSDSEDFSPVAAASIPEHATENDKGGRRRPDYKFKKASRKNKHKSTKSTNADGGLAIGRKGGVLRVSM